MLRNPGFQIEVVHGDALKFEADVLMLKYAQQFFGLDMSVATRLAQSGITMLSNNPPAEGDDMLIEAPPEFKSRWILVVGTVSLRFMGYDEIRGLAYGMLAGLHTRGLNIMHVATTIHGAKSGLDEAEALRSMLLGFTAAAEDGFVPATLQKISIIERDKLRADFLKDALQSFLPPQPADQQAQPLQDTLERASTELASILSGRESLDEAARKPLADEKTPHIFVAMPFAEEYDDHFYLAIRPAVTANKMLCVRLDQDDVTFTGDIMEQVKERIRTAQLVIALLDARNPNVYLEVGYAWGVGTPTVLILNEDEQPPFDVQSEKLMTYKRMHKLKSDLEDELRRLLK